jgi:hypothetical protein
MIWGGNGFAWFNERDIQTFFFFLAIRAVLILQSSLLGHDE